jgi:hypothetical protein
LSLACDRLVRQPRRDRHELTRATAGERDRDGSGDANQVTGRDEQWRVIDLRAHGRADHFAARDQRGVRPEALLRFRVLAD